MAFSSIIRFLSRSPLTQDLLTKLEQQQQIRLSGAARFPKGLVVSGLAQAQNRPLLIVTATLEEAGRWTAQLEAMNWATVYFYPTSESSPYEPFDPESEMVWGQMQVLADLVAQQDAPGAASENGTNFKPGRLAIVATERSLQPHLPPVEAFKPYNVTLQRGMDLNLGGLSDTLARLGYERVPSVETEGQWSRRGDILDIFPVASELPVRLELFGDELERMREFDPATQRSLDAIEQLVLTPTSFKPLIHQTLAEQKTDLTPYLSAADLEKYENEQTLDGTRRLLGVAYDQPASLLDYLPEDTLIAWDEPEQCQAHGDRWYEHVTDHWQETLGADGKTRFPQLHRPTAEAFELLQLFQGVQLSQLYEIGATQHARALPTNYELNLASAPIPTLPHQFAKMATTIRAERDRNFAVWLASAQPSRTVALLQEHDCPAQFVPNPRDYPAIDKAQVQHVPVAVKYSGLAELEGFSLPTFRLAIATDREFFGQHTLATPSYVRKRRRAASKQVDPNKLRQGDYVVHRNHGVGQFLKLESLTVNGETREYLVLQYADGLLRVAADQVGTLSRYRRLGTEKPPLNKMSGKAWEKTKARARKAIKKVAVDLLKLYAQRSQ
ncbi:MAG: CarD family transcriptional regulator, partial [Cyanobacteria bacterium P01_H01_bin.121]